MEEKQKIPSNLKEHISSYFDDIKKYVEIKRILRRNKVVMICERCNNVEAYSDSMKCKECDCYLKLFPSSAVNISIPSRKEKYKQILKKNEEIDNRKQLLKKLEVETFLNDYEERINKIKNIDYNEILECFIEIQKLDEYYEKLSNDKKQLLTNLEIEKNKTVQKILDNKFAKIRMVKDNYELCHSYLEEIKYCRKRFPKYNKYFNIVTIKIENYLEDLKNISKKN